VAATFDYKIGFPSTCFVPAELSEYSCDRQVPSTSQGRQDELESFWNIILYAILSFPNYLTSSYFNLIHVVTHSVGDSQASVNPSPYSWSNFESLLPSSSPSFPAVAFFSLAFNFAFSSSHEANVICSMSRITC
jgi:hypothetical protein